MPGASENGRRCNLPGAAAAHDTELQPRVRSRTSVTVSVHGFSLPCQCLGPKSSLAATQPLSPRAG